jgi:hypothetical protein
MFVINAPLVLIYYPQLKRQLKWYCKISSPALNDNHHFNEQHFKVSSQLNKMWLATTTVRSCFIMYTQWQLREVLTPVVVLSMSEFLNASYSTKN